MSEATGTPAMAIDPDALRRKYREERDKRLRSEGNRQYVDMVGEFASFAEDPYVTERVEREPLTDTVDVIILGGGFSGMITAGRLRQAGVKRIRIVEKGGDFGGTWYWNRYPGIRCDVESYIYMPFLEELGYVPTEKYAKGAEILAHCQEVGKFFDLYSDACFQTVVQRVWWDDDTAEWVVETDRGDAMRARFICLGSGGMHRPKLPGIPGIENFRGNAFHTSRWDYSLTGGDADGNLTGLRAKRVGIIGTGASAIQCIPHLAEWSKELVVFQRTPSSVDIRNNKPTDPEWAQTLEPGWQRERMINFTSILLGVPQDKDLVADRWTDVWARMGRYQSSHNEETGPANAADMLQLADFEKMAEIRARIDSIIDDPATAESLKPWYNLFCKRPLYSDEYLQVFNRPNVTLVDTDGRGVERITETAVVFDDVEYPVDVLVYATGFNVGVPPHQTGEFQVVGRGGVDLASRWKGGGCPSVHGMYSAGFPNMYFLGQGCQASLTTNVPHMLNEQASHVAAVIAQCQKDGVKSMEVRREAEQTWAAAMQAKAVDRQRFLEECTPSYFNNEGEIDRPTVLTRGYGGGPLEYIEILARWRTTEMARDVEFTYE
jgi:cation diffusion facilitator CzcD-associated flavoprotein CzcO